MLWYMCLSALIQIGACVCPERCSCSKTSEVTCSELSTTPSFPIYTRRIDLSYQVGSEIHPFTFTSERLPYVTNINIGGSLEVIRPFAFKGLTISSIFISASIEKIENYSFFGLEVKRLTFWSNVGSIGAFSFSHIGPSYISFSSIEIVEIKSQAFANTSHASFDWSGNVIQNLECDTIDHLPEISRKWSPDNTLSCDNSLCWLFNSSQSTLIDGYCAYPSAYRTVGDFLAQPPDNITSLCGMEQSACSRSQAPPICDFTSEEVINITCMPTKTTTLQMLTDRMTEESTPRQMPVETTTPYAPVETTKQRMSVKITTLWMADKSFTQHMPFKTGTLQTSSTSPMVENSSEFQDINECERGSVEFCGRNSVCFNINGSFECRCSHGHTSPTSDGTNCKPISDINVCERGSVELCGRNSVCFNINGTHECRCSHNHTSPTGDGTNCTPISVKDNFAAGIGIGLAIGLGTTCLVISIIVFVQLRRRRRRLAQKTLREV